MTDDWCRQILAAGLDWMWELYQPANDCWLRCDVGRDEWNQTSCRRVLCNNITSHHINIVIISDVCRRVLCNNNTSHHTNINTVIISDVCTRVLCNNITSHHINIVIISNVCRRVLCNNITSHHINIVIISNVCRHVLWNDITSRHIYIVIISNVCTMSRYIWQHKQYLTPLCALILLVGHPASNNCCYNNSQTFTFVDRLNME